MGMITDGNSAVIEAWAQRVAALWDEFNPQKPSTFLERMKALAAERPADDALALFELASAHDSTGYEAEAAPLYQRALATGLPDQLRRRAVIQYASTLRNLGRLDESIVLLTKEQGEKSDHLDDAVSAFLALSLVDSGREREAVGLALAALAQHLPRYNRSLTNYARALMVDNQ